MINWIKKKRKLWLSNTVLIKTLRLMVLEHSLRFELRNTYIEDMEKRMKLHNIAFDDLKEKSRSMEGCNWHQISENLTKTLKHTNTEHKSAYDWICGIKD